MKKEVVYSMAFTRQKALERLDNLSLIISEHMFKLILLPKHQSVPHWKQELKSWRKALSRYNVAKTKNPNFNKPTLKKYIYIEPLSSYADRKLLHQMVKADYDIDVKMPSNIEQKLEKITDLYIESILNNNDDWL